MRLVVKSEDRTSGERDPIRPRLRNYGPGDRHSRELPRVVPAKAPYARGQDRYAPGIKSKGARPVTRATLAKFALEDLRNAIFVLIFAAAISIVLICYLSFHKPRDEVKGVCLGRRIIGILTDTFSLSART